MIIYLDLTLPPGSSDPPENTAGNCIVFYSVLLRMGFTCALVVTNKAVVSYAAFPPLPAEPAEYFCCTGLGVTSTGRYPASCPLKPGLSSSAAFRHCSRDHLSYLLSTIIYFISFFLAMGNSYRNKNYSRGYLYPYALGMDIVLHVSELTRLSNVYVAGIVNSSVLHTSELTRLSNQAYYYWIDKLVLHTSELTRLSNSMCCHQFQK